MTELDKLGNEPNFDLFGSFGFDFFSDDELLLTETEKIENSTKIKNFFEEVLYKTCLFIYDRKNFRG